MQPELPVERDDGGMVVAVEFGGGWRSCEDEAGVFELEDADLEHFPMAAWPAGVRFRVVGDVYTIVLDATIVREESGRVVASVAETIYRKYWDHPYGAGRFAPALQRAVEMRAAAEGDVRFDSLEDDLAWINIAYDIATTYDGTAAEAYRRLCKANAELWGAAEALLSGRAIEPEALQDEKRFTLEVILPLLRSLGAQDVAYTHGVREHGRDITFTEVGVFGLRRFYGVQVKAGDVSGAAGSDFDQILAQLEHAFTTPYIDVSSRQPRYVNDMIVAISGRFTDNAKDLIAGKLQNRAIWFIDIDKVQELLAQQFPPQS